MKKGLIGETYRQNTDALPPLRTDVRFGTLNDKAFETLAVERVIVLSEFFSQETTTDIRNTARNWLAVHAPIRIGRKALQKVIPEPNQLPSYLKRRPFAPPLIVKPLLPYSVAHAIERVEDVNAKLYHNPALANIYGIRSRKLTNVLFNRTPRSMWFARHQDSQGIHGFGFAAQTADTLWHVSPSETEEGAQDFTFHTHPGDLVVLRERADPLDDSGPLVLGKGYDDFNVDGSLVHTGLNMSDDRVRYTMNLFSVERKEN